MTDETKKLIEEKIADGLVDLDKYEIGSKERSSVKSEVCELIDKLVAIEHNDDERTDREEKREIDREKNEAQINLEYAKSEIGWKRMALEIGKVVVPVVVPMIAYDVFQKRLMKFEETGRISSTAGRELHLPKFFK